MDMCIDLTEIYPVLFLNGVKSHCLHKNLFHSLERLMLLNGNIFDKYFQLMSKN